MIASVHVVDSGIAANLRRRAPKPASVPGLRWCRKALCAELGPSAVPDADLHRGGIVAWWDDDTALDSFLSSDPRAETYRSGWTVRLEPVRGRAAWPDAEFDPTPAEPIAHEGIHAAVTLGTARVPRFPGFMRTSSHLEKQFTEDSGALWGLGMLPRIVMTLTFWESAEATDAYVNSGAHRAAMDEHYDFRTDTHTYIAEGGFFGFRPYGTAGRLTGANPTPDAISA